MILTKMTGCFCISIDLKSIDLSHSLDVHLCSLFIYVIFIFIFLLVINLGTKFYTLVNLYFGKCWKIRGKWIILILVRQDAKVRRLVYRKVRNIIQR